MDDPRGITLGNSKTWRGNTYTIFGKYIIIKKS